MVFSRDGITIHLADCREALQAMEPASVNTCVTSPPYWGLRDYGIESSVWGGDCDCRHEWWLRTEVPQGEFCQKCGAWAGAFGLEPTPELFVEHAVEIFREVRRVLRDDGTLWLNIGTSYAGSWGNYGGANRGAGKQRQIVKGSRAPRNEQLDERTKFRPPAASFGGKNPSQSRLLQRVPACDTSERQDCEQEPLSASPHDVLPSTTLESSSQPSVASGLEHLDEVSSPQPTVSSASLHSEHTKACTCGTSPMSPPLVVRTQGKESFFSACGRSDCKGIGKCGMCWCSLAIPSLNLKPKDEINIPHLVAMALQADGWYLRQTIVWHKPNPMPESVRDRCTKAHEYIFLLSKSARYYFDQDAIRLPLADASVDRLSQPNIENQKGSERAHAGGKTNGNMKAVRKSGNKARKPASARGVPVDTDGKTTGAVAGSVPWEGNTANRRTVWTVPTRPYSGAHFAVFPPDLIEPCILAGCPEGGVVLDPFLGSGTTAEVAQRNGCRFVGCEMNPDYFKLATKRFDQRRLFGFDNEQETPVRPSQDDGPAEKAG